MLHHVCLIDANLANFLDSFRCADRILEYGEEFSVNLSWLRSLHHALTIVPYFLFEALFEDLHDIFWII